MLAHVTTARLPLRVRLGVAVVVVLAVAVVAGAAAAVQVGAHALDVGGGFVVSSAYGTQPRWAGIEVRNPGALPITLHTVQPRVLEDAEVIEARVIDSSSDHLLLAGEPLERDAQAVLDRSRPLDGFVLPAHSGDRYQVVVRFRPRTPGEQMVLARAAVTYSVFGIDHGAISDGIYCVRAPGAKTCPPYESDLGS